MGCQLITTGAGSCHHWGACADSCWDAQVPVVHGKAQNFSCDHCSGCMTSFATLGFMYVFGVSPVGPLPYGQAARLARTRA